jgi:DNA-binding transcriptional LysR family regulator
VGLGVLPDFIVRDAIADGRLEILFPEWSLPAGAVHWVTPPGGPKPKRLELLGDFIASRLARRDDKPPALPSAKRRAR